MHHNFVKITKLHFGKNFVYCIRQLEFYIEFYWIEKNSLSGLFIVCTAWGEAYDSLAICFLGTATEFELFHHFTLMGYERFAKYTDFYIQ